MHESDAQEQLPHYERVGKDAYIIQSYLRK